LDEERTVGMRTREVVEGRVRRKLEMRRVQVV
jgi:hypothetical protein